MLLHFRFLLFFLLSLYPGYASALVEIRMLCWEGYAPIDKVKIFEKYIEKKYEQKLKLTVIPVSEPQEFFTGFRNKTVDIISPAHNIPKSNRWPFIRNELPLALPLNLENIPNYHRVNPSLQYLSYVLNNNEIYGVPIVYGSYGLAYNTNKFIKPPESWDIFWRPEYVGKYSISADYHEANIYITALSLGYKGEQIYDYNLLSKDKVFIRRLAHLSGSSASRWHGVDKSENLLGLSLATAWGFSFSALKQKGELWAFASPKEGVTGWVDHWLISTYLKESPLKRKIAEEWINYTLSDEMQIYYLNVLGQFPVVNGIKNKLTQEKIDKFQLDNDNYIKNSFILWPILTRRQQNGFTLLWKQAKGEYY